MAAAMIESMCPFFIVSDVTGSVSFYEDKLGFAVEYQHPEQAPFFAVMRRDNAMLFLKSGDAKPQPNAKRDPEMRWDAYCLVSDPDALAQEFARRGAAFSIGLRDTHEGLRGFEISDPDGYVLFFGRPKT